MTEILLDAAAREVYRTILRDGGRIHLSEIGPEEEPVVRRLADFGLLALRTTDGTYSAVDPRTVSERIGTGLREEGARLIARAAAVPKLLDGLIQAYDAAPRSHPEPSSGVEYVAGETEIRHRIERIRNDHPHEVLLMQPGTSPADHLKDALSNCRHLEHGGALRTIYESSVRLDSATVSFAADCTELGAVFRVLPIPFTRLVIFGRAVAVIPADPDNSSAAFVEDPSVVDFLVRDFELHWSQAEAVNWASLASGSADSLTQDQVGRLLSQGLTQKAIASRLALSERTVAGHIARLRERYDAETLFQLGWQMRGGGRDA